MKIIALIATFSLLFAASASAATVSVRPRLIGAGDPFIIEGRGFNSNHLTIFAINSGKRARFGWAKPDPWGRFNVKMRTRRDMIGGRFIIQVCAKGNCKKESARARIYIK